MNAVAARELINKCGAQDAIKDTWFGGVQLARERYESREFCIPYLNDIFKPAMQSVSVGMVFAPIPTRYPMSSVYLLEVIPDGDLPRKTGIVEAITCKSYRVTWREIEKSDVERVLDVIYSPPSNNIIGWPCYSEIRINVPRHQDFWRIGKQAPSLLRGWNRNNTAMEHAAANLEKLVDSMAPQARHWIPARALVSTTYSRGEEWAIALIKSKEYDILVLEKSGECLACDILNEMFEEERNIINGALMYPDQKNMTEALRVLAQADTRRKIRKLLSSL